MIMNSAYTNMKLDVARHITEICHQLQSAGFETYIVGGAVRDFLIGRIPKDYDLSTSATPEEIRGEFGRRKARIIGRRFRLVHLVHGQEIIEVSTFRRIPSREAQDVKIRQKLGDVPQNMIFSDNEFGSAVEDAERRDFTVNALFYDPVKEQLVDHTGMGLDDVRAGLIRAIGDPALRFEEDPVRILRALKFAGQCDMEFEEDTRRALMDSIPLIQLAAPSRLTLELEKILKNPRGHKILRLFQHYGFLKYFLPELSRELERDKDCEALSLLEIRNRRMEAGCYRDSISVAIALLSLGRMEKRYGVLSPGCQWMDAVNREELADEVYSQVKGCFHPHALIRAVIYSAQRSLMVMGRVLDFERPASRLLANPGYAHAREMALILNESRWHVKGLEETLPEMPEHFAPHHKLRHGHPRKQDKRKHRGQTG